MSKNIIINTITVIILVAGVYLYQNNNSKLLESQNITDQKDTGITQEKPNSADAMITKASSYVPYSKEVLDSTSSTRRVLFFYANWCSTCIPADADFEKNVSMIPQDVTVIRVNYNDKDADAGEKALATKYGVTYQHTFVQIDEAGEMVVQWNGGSTKELLAKIK